MGYETSKHKQCVCKEGLLLDEETRLCVKPEACKKFGLCDPNKNEVFAACYQCERTCDQLVATEPMQTYPNVDCQAITIKNFFNINPPKDCYPTCVCAPGFARSSQGKCIPSSECSKQCTSTRQVYVDCHAECYPTSSNPNVTTDCFYRKSACQSGCVCSAAANLKETSNGLIDLWNKCVAKSKLTATSNTSIVNDKVCTDNFCKKNSNESWNFRGFNNCLGRCYDFNPEVCFQDECNFCTCSPGYVRNYNDKCVLETEC